MPDYGVTDKGFEIKRMEDIIEEIHSDLTEGFGFDTRLADDQSFLNVLVLTNAAQLADLWEVAQDEYYAKFVATATGLNLDHAVQYGGIKRKAAQQNAYPLHCTGDDGTLVPQGAIVSTSTTPAVRLYSGEQFEIARENCNSLSIRVAVIEAGAYTVSINGTEYSYTCPSDSTPESTILGGISSAITDAGYTKEVVEDDDGYLLKITDGTIGRSNEIAMSDNLTTESVTVIATFITEEYGKITIPNGLVTVMVTNITGFNSVMNLLPPTYGRDRETDVELRHSYMQKKAIRSNTMLDSIEAELVNNIDGVEAARGYENSSDSTDEMGLPPHSIEIVVDGGSDSDVAQAILLRKAGGIQTYGNTTVNVLGVYGDQIPIKFSRPQGIYSWLKVVLHGDQSSLPTNYSELAIGSIMEYAEDLVCGDDLLIQLLLDGIYDSIAGLSYVDITVAYSSDSGFEPSSEDYTQGNIIVTARQKILLAEARIEVSFSADS